MHDRMIAVPGQFESLIIKELPCWFVLRYTSMGTFQMLIPVTVGWALSGPGRHRRVAAASAATLIDCFTSVILLFRTAIAARDGSFRGCPEGPRGQANDSPTRPVIDPTL
jgi:hypothetical protein